MAKIQTFRRMPKNRQPPTIDRPKSLGSQGGLFGITSLRSVIPPARRGALANYQRSPQLSLRKVAFFYADRWLVSKLPATYLHKKTSAFAEVLGFFAIL